MENLLEQTAATGSLNIYLKPLTLSFIKSEDETTWDKIVTDSQENIVFEQKNIILFEENNNKEYFDGWEAQLRAIPVWNIAEVKRFI
jgi:hypothetical protein